MGNCFDFSCICLMSLTVVNHFAPSPFSNDVCNVFYSTAQSVGSVQKNCMMFTCFATILCHYFASIKVGLPTFVYYNSVCTHICKLRIFYFIQILDVHVHL